MNISYVDFWGGFDSKCNWFNLAFREILNDREINFCANPEEADVIVFSVFGNSKIKYRNSKALKIFFTGENSRADLSIADYSISFDFDTFGGRNFRLPIWYLYVNWWGEFNFPHAEITTDMLFRKHDPEEVLSRKEFCSIVIGNAVRNRLEVAQELSSYKPVHGYGKVFGNHFSGSKIDLISKYRYNICFENSVYPGYTTEKLMEAKVAGCVPIYYGTETVSSDFNPKCFVNFSETKKPTDILNEICRLEDNRDQFKLIAEEQLFIKKPNLDDFYSFLRNAMRKI